MLKFTKTEPGKDEYAKKEYAASNFIPYKAYWNHNTIITKDEALLKCIKVSGFSFETADDEDLDIKKNLRNTLFKGLSTGGISLYIHTIRRRHTVVKDEFEQENAGEPSTFAEYVEKAWKKKQVGQEAFTNELYITVINRPDVGGAAIFEHLLKKIQQSTDKANWGLQMKDRYEELEEVTGRVMSTLSDYNPKLLSVVKTEDGYHSEILEFLGKIANCGLVSQYNFNYGSIDESLSTSRLYFGNRNVEVKNPQGTRYAGVLSIKEYSPSTSPGIFDGFLHMPCELIVSQSFTFSNRQVAISKMQLQQNRMIQAEDKAISQISEISEALDMAMSGRIGFGLHHMTVMCIEEDPKKLEFYLSQATVELSNVGIQPVREKVNLEPCFWGQLPGNDSFLIRRATVNTLNLSSFASFHNYPLGKPYGNHWGDAVTVLN